MDEVVFSAIVVDTLVRLSWESSGMGDNAIFNKINASKLGRNLRDKHPKIDRMIELRAKIAPR